jgi:hypothetical protein
MLFQSRGMCVPGTPPPCGNKNPSYPRVVIRTRLILRVPHAALAVKVGPVAYSFLRICRTATPSAPDDYLDTT